MNTWILLLLLLGGSNGGCTQRDVSCRNTREHGRGRDCNGGNSRDRDRNGGSGRDRDCDCDRGRDRDCDRGRGHDHDRDCDGNDSRFEPRFDARPFGGGETCGCDEKND